MWFTDKINKIKDKLDFCKNLKDFLPMQIKISANI